MAWSALTFMERIVMMHARYSPVLILTLGLVGCLGGSSNALSFEECPCKHVLAPNSTTVCGYLTVPENRSNPASGNIQVYVTIFKNPNAGVMPGSGPLLFLTGGPGASTADANALFENATNNSSYKSFVDTFRDNRDLIVVDQRGSNYSIPSLYCSEETGGLRDSVYGLSFEELCAQRIQAVEACYQRLKESGYDLSAYNTYENAADVKDLCAALKLNKVNIYGASYGTRLSLIIMNQYPELCRSVVLDSVLPPEINPFTAQPNGVMYGLLSFFDACQADFPATQQNFYDIITRLEANPVATVGHGVDSTGKSFQTTIPISDEMFVSYVMSDLRSVPYDKYLPANIEYIYNTQDYSLVADSWISNVQYLFPAGFGGSNDPSLGMFESMTASDDGYYTSPWDISAACQAALSNPGILGWGENSFLNVEPAVQGLWPVDPVPPQIQNPVVSSIPTLLMAGSIDTGTPPTWAADAASHLSNSFTFTILGGHGVAAWPCAGQLMDDFVNDPTTQPTSPCPTTYAWSATPASYARSAGASKRNQSIYSFWGGSAW